MKMRHRHEARFLRRGAIACVSVLLIGTSACAAESSLGGPQDSFPEVSIEGMEEVHALLDFETANAVTPMSKYLINSDFELQALYSHSAATIIDNCMTEQGEQVKSLGVV